MYLADYFSSLLKSLFVCVLFENVPPNPKRYAPYKTETTFIQICNKNVYVTGLLQECINFVRFTHRSVKKLVTILQQNCIAYFQKF